LEPRRAARRAHYDRHSHSCPRRSVRPVTAPIRSGATGQGILPGTALVTSA
jgi:hypothetical protein